MPGFKSLAEMRKGRGSIADLQKEVEKLSQSNYEKDERFWQPTVDKAGVGSATIRFLPPPKGEDMSWVRYWNHAFEGPTGKWYIENSLTTLNQADPVGEMNSELWNSGDAGKEIARKQKRKLHFVSNILVITDPKAPENEGKVFLYRYGVKIFDKIKDAMNPPEGDDTEPFSPFDFFTGANFKLKIQNVKGYRNYDKSSFAECTELSEDEDYLEEIWSSEHSLAAEVAPDKFKTYDELKKKLQSVLKGGAVGTQAKEEEGDDTDSESDKITRQFKGSAKSEPESEEDEDDAPVLRKKSGKATAKRAEAEEEEEVEEEPTPVKRGKKAAPVEEDEEVEAPKKGKKSAPKKKAVEEDDEESLSYFKQLAEED